MNDQAGIELLKESIEKVAATLPASAATRSTRSKRRWRWLAAAAVIVGVAVFAGALWLRPWAAKASSVEVVSLKINGEPARVKVIDSAAAGSIVVFPVRPKSAGPAAIVWGVQ